MPPNFPRVRKDGSAYVRWPEYTILSMVAVAAGKDGFDYCGSGKVVSAYAGDRKPVVETTGLFS